VRLKVKEIKHYRAKLLKKQDGVCPLCDTAIESGQDTLDHDHGTGHVRRVLCRNCNQIEGRVLAWIKKCYTDPINFLHNLSTYWLDDYTRNPFHPSHKTDTEKEISRLRKRMKRLKTDRGKQKYRDKINKLKEQV